MLSVCLSVCPWSASPSSPSCCPCSESLESFVSFALFVYLSAPGPSCPVDAIRLRPSILTVSPWSPLCPSPCLSISLPRAFLSCRCHSPPSFYPYSESLESFTLSAHSFPLLRLCLAVLAVNPLSPSPYMFVSMSALGLPVFSSLLYTSPWACLSAHGLPVFSSLLYSLSPWACCRSAHGLPVLRLRPSVLIVSP